MSDFRSGDERSYARKSDARQFILNFILCKTAAVETRTVPVHRRSLCGRDSDTTHSSLERNRLCVDPYDAGHAALVRALRTI